MKKVIYLAGGCFWGTEKYFSQVKGVVETSVGYANGNTDNPTYEQVCRNDTGHAEAVRVVFDDDVIGLPFLLSLYYETIDPVSVNRQGGDIGTQYRTGIYYTEADDESVIRASIAMLQKQYRKKIAIEVLPLLHFYTGEEYHQKYLDKNPSGYCHIGSIEFKRAREAIDPSKRYRVKSKSELLQLLTPMQFSVTQNNGTEPPFQNEYHDTFKKGIYVDITTGEPLFISTDKFESGCGWPSFSKPIHEDLIVRKTDRGFGMKRTEVRSKNSDIHLGHVFKDGKKELGGLRYCINSAALRFVAFEDLQREGYGELVLLFKEC